MKNRTVIVFGGSSGIGEATARLLARQGAAVTIVGRDADKLARAAKGMDGVRTAVADGLDTKAVEAALETAGDKIDDVVICVSGGKGAGLFRDLNLADVADAFRQKTLAQLTIAQVAAKRGVASITFVTAASPRSVIRGTAGLAAVNGALEQLVPILAVELAPTRVNAVSPGIVDTAWWDGMPQAAKEGFFATAAKTLPVGRVGQPEEVADLIATITRGGFITGSIFEIDGGSHLITQ